MLLQLETSRKIRSHHTQMIRFWPTLNYIGSDHFESSAGTCIGGPYLLLYSFTKGAGFLCVIHCVYWFGLYLHSIFTTAPFLILTHDCSKRNGLKCDINVYGNLYLRTGGLKNAFLGIVLAYFRGCIWYRSNPLDISQMTYSLAFSNINV